VTKPIDMAALRRTIEAAPVGGEGAIVSRRWLEQVERQLLAAQAMVGAERGIAGVCDAIQARAAG
jgi:hypothetical protein